MVQRNVVWIEASGDAPITDCTALVVIANNWTVKPAQYRDGLWIDMVDKAFVEIAYWADLPLAPTPPAQIG